MKKDYSFTVIVLLTFFTSGLVSIITPMAEELSSALGFGEANIAQINSFFLMVGAVSSFIWATIGDRVSRKKLLFVATLEWSIFTFLTIFATDYNSLLTYQLLAAIGFGAALPLSFSLTVDIVNVKERGGKFGLLSAVYVLGIGLGQILSGFLIDFYPWQIPFIIIALGGLAVTGLLFLVEEPARGAKDDLYSAPKEDELDYKIDLKDFKIIWNIKSTFLILIFNLALFISMGAVSSLFIPFLKNDFQFSSTIATLFLIVVFGGQIPSGPLFGKLGDKLYKKNVTGRIKVIAICLIAGGVFYLSAFLLDFTFQNLTLSIIFLILVFLGAFFFGGIDPLTQATLGEINPPKIRSTIFAINYISGTIGRSISLLIVSQFFITFNGLYRPGYIIISAMALAINIILIPIFKKLPQDIQTIKEGSLEE
ncbi:MAG: MFS transporter [Promethearchaeia archaeon]